MNDSFDAAPRREPSIVVLGIGNLLWADEGFGVRCVEALQAGWDFAPPVRLVDGGTQGLYLLPLVQSATHLLILDAVDFGRAPGTLHAVAGNEVPRWLGARKMSLHQTGFQEVLALAQLASGGPDELLLIGCQPEELKDYGGSLRPRVKAAMAAALPLALQALERWGAQPRPRRAPPPVAESLNAAGVGLEAYEAGRPSALAACRSGDARFLMTTSAAR